MHAKCGGWGVEKVESRKRATHAAGPVRQLPAGLRRMTLGPVNDANLHRALWLRARRPRVQFSPLHYYTTYLRHIHSFGDPFEFAAFLCFGVCLVDACSRSRIWLLSTRPTARLIEVEEAQR